MWSRTMELYRTLKIKNYFLCMSPIGYIRIMQGCFSLEISNVRNWDDEEAINQN